MAGTNVVSLWTMRLDGNTNPTDPAHVVYPNADIEAFLFMTAYARHFSLFGRSAMAAGSLTFGDVGANLTGVPGVGATSQSARGFGDPIGEFSINLIGAPKLPSFYAMLNYEPRFTMDISGILSFPVGEYSSARAVNLGTNRWWGRVALPMMLRIGPYVRGQRTSLEVIPSGYFFATNGDVGGQDLDNDPLFQLEAHLTRDLARKLFASIDMVYRYGAQAAMDGVEFGNPLNITQLGLSVDCTVSDNFGLRLSYLTTVGDDVGEANMDMFRIMFNFGWHKLVEDVNAL